MSDWVKRLAAESPEEFADIAIPERPEEAAPQEWHDLYWRAWYALRFDRSYGALGGVHPVTYSAISRYARDHGIAGVEFETFRTLFKAIDAEWLAYLEEKSKTEGD